jgi:hypothetical protein
MRNPGVLGNVTQEENEQKQDPHPAESPPAEGYKLFGLSEV